LLVLLVWIGIGLLTLFGVAFVALHLWVQFNFREHIVRIFQEKPLFIIPRGQPVPEAEDVSFPTTDGLTLRGCYLRGEGAEGGAGARNGVVVFGLEFGSNRWACVPYCDFLRQRGFDIFSFESRNQGESDSQPGYEPLQWVTDFEVADFRAALAYLKSRPDADARGVGLFGLSKGGSAGLLVAAADPFVRCFVTDGIFATHTTMVPYMRQWLRIFSRKYWLQNMIPNWYFKMWANIGLRQIERQRGCRFPHLENLMSRLGQRPFLMIHGAADTYIKPAMAQALFDLVKGPKEFWLVDNAKHNQAFHLAAEEYQQRVLRFFETHLAEKKIERAPSANGEVGSHAVEIRREQ
jgi:uncharacterized protein